MRYESPLEKGIAINAAAEGEYPPDLFRLKVSFEAEKDTREECIKTYKKDYMNVRDALVEAGVSEDIIVSGPFSVVTHYEWVYEKIEESSSEKYREEYRRVRNEVDGYDYEGSLSIELPMDLQLIKTLWSSLNGIEGNFGFDFGYKLEHPEIYERELLEQAIAEAYERAKVLASAADIKLGSVEAISHDCRYARHVGTELEYSSREIIACRAKPAFGSDDAYAMPDLTPENISVSCSVTLRWAVEQ